MREGSFGGGRDGGRGGRGGGRGGGRDGGRGRGGGRGGGRGSGALGVDRRGGRGGGSRRGSGRGIRSSQSVMSQGGGVLHGRIERAHVRGAWRTGRVSFSRENEVGGSDGFQAQTGNKLCTGSGA